MKSINRDSKLNSTFAIRAVKTIAIYFNASSALIVVMEDSKGRTSASLKFSVSFLVFLVSVLFSEICFRVFDDVTQLRAPTITSEVCDSLHESNEEKTTFWLFHSAGRYDVLDTVVTVLNRLGLEKVPMNATAAGIHYDWNLLWSYDHHMTLRLNYSAISFDQKLNHWPGSGAMTSKSVFTTNTLSKYVPRGFLSVDAVESYVRLHPNKRFVVKKKSNRGVILQNVTDMNFTSNSFSDGYFAMEFVENPLLFNGHKFDFAVYVVITSVNPLRVYYYNKNIIMRFCPKTYDTSDPEDRDRYVVRSSHIPGSKFPGIKEFNDKGYTYKEGFNAFLRSKGVDENIIWAKVEDLIRSIVVSKEKFLIREVR